MPHLKALKVLLKSYSPIALAFSGGLDSRFLAYVAKVFGPKHSKIHLFHIRGPHVQEEETRNAVIWAKTNGLPISLVPLDPLDVPNVKANGKERCYFCKRYIFSTLKTAAAEHPELVNPTLCDGTNFSDRQSIRPGLRALVEYGIRSPLAEAGLAKDAIRQIGKNIGLDKPEQVARPCLLTRFEYELIPTREALIALDAAEVAVAGVLNTCKGDEFYLTDEAGLPGLDFRLRLVHGARLAQKNIMQSVGSEYVPSPYTVELHLSRRPAAQLQRKLADTIAQHGWSEPQFITSAQVSGHFDRIYKPLSDN